MHTDREFTSDGEVAAIGCGLVHRNLPKAEWTHRAHFAAAMWLFSTRPDLDAFGAMPGLIRAYNESTGTPNTDGSGYHETITRASLRAAHWFWTAHRDEPLFVICNKLMRSPLGSSEWLLTYWSRPVLFSAEARRAWVEPDLRPLLF